jgi:hypothetical protein
MIADAEEPLKLLKLSTIAAFKSKIKEMNNGRPFKDYENIKEAFYLIDFLENYYSGSNTNILIKKAILKLGNNDM